MPDPSDFTNPLGGHEVVADVLAQIRKKLATDCNLRATDGYSGGYSGKITIALKLYAVRVNEVSMEIPITQSAGVKAPAVDDFPPEEIEAVEINDAISIPLEPNLKEVRNRTKENNDEASEASAPVEKEDTSQRPKRRYLRRAALAGAMSGE